MSVCRPYGREVLAEDRPSLEPPRKAGETIAGLPKRVYVAVRSVFEHNDVLAMGSPTIFNGRRWLA